MTALLAGIPPQIIEAACLEFGLDAKRAKKADILAAVQTIRERDDALQARHDAAAARRAKKEARRIEQEAAESRANLAQQRRDMLRFLDSGGLSTDGDTQALLDKMAACGIEQVAQRLKEKDVAVEIEVARGAGVVRQVTLYYGQTADGRTVAKAASVNLSAEKGTMYVWIDKEGGCLQTEWSRQYALANACARRFTLQRYVRYAPSGEGWNRETHGRLTVGPRGETVVPNERAHRRFMSQILEEGRAMGMAI